MGSSRDESPRPQRGFGALALACAAALIASCSVGHGDGEVGGTVFVANCVDGSYELSPTAFLAESVEQLLKVRVQRGSDIEVRSDGLAVLVEDAALVKRAWLGREIAIGGADAPRVELSLYLNESCPPDRDKTPVALGAVSGSIRFSALYAPKVSRRQVRIAAELANVRFEDSRTDQRWAELSGFFDFLYVRGSPAQRFP